MNRQKNKRYLARNWYTEICISGLTILGEEKNGVEEASSPLFSFLYRAHIILHNLIDSSIFSLPFYHKVISNNGLVY